MGRGGWSKYIEVRLIEKDGMENTAASNIGDAIPGCVLAVKIVSGNGNGNIQEF